jgi:Domain of unknown function (DUF222)/HNH endonuclease
MSLTDTATNDTSDIRPLEERLAETVGLLNVVTAELVVLIAEALRAGAWEGFGIRSPEHWVVWRCGVSPTRARRLVAAARKLDRLPHVGALFEAGSLTEDQTAVIVRHTDADHDLQVAELAPSLTVPQLARVLPSLPRPEPDPPPDDRPPGDDAGARPVRRAVRFAYGDDGMWWCSIRLPSDEGAVVQKALELGRDHEFWQRNPNRRNGGRSGAGDPGDVSWADALLRIAHTGLDGLDSTNGRTPGERTQVILHLNADRQAPPRLHLGPVLPAGTADYLSCDSTVRYLLVRRGQPLAMGRRQRTVALRLRTAIEHRDGGCRVPGCDRSRWLHIHHLVHWTHGGRTDPDNLVTLCTVHHRMVHLGALSIDGDPGRHDGLAFTDDQGRHLRPAPPRPPHADTTAAEAARHQRLPQARWQHPPGEPLDTRWISWN